MDEKFSWIQTHKELSAYLTGKEDSQKELIALLKSVGVGPFNDKDAPGERNIELDEIDPFTFFCYIYKYKAKRLKILQDIAKKLNLTVPTSTNGVPSAQAQRVWLFPSKYLRTHNEVPRLWNFFYKLLENEVTETDFEDVLKIKNIGKAKLTEAMFYVKPELYLPINGPSIPYIKEKLGIDPAFDTYTEYQQLLARIKEKTEVPFYELSAEAAYYSMEKKSTIQQPSLNVELAKKYFEAYVSYCSRSQWLTYRESYKFRFARWLNERVDFDSQSDEEIFAICKASQQQQYDEDSTSKGLNFILSALRFKDDFIVQQDIALMRRIYEGDQLVDGDLKDSPLTFPKFSVWLGTLLPEEYEIYASDELNSSIQHLFDLDGVSSHGAEGFYQANSLLSALREYLTANYSKEIEQLIGQIFPDDASVRPCDIAWLVQDFTIYVNRMILNREIHYYWVNQGTSYKKERDAGIIAAPNGSLHHHKRLKELFEGDIIIHYSEGAIRATSTVAKEFKVGSRPYEFKEYGLEDTLIVGVEYNELKGPIEIEQIQNTFQGNESVLPKKYSPLNKKLEINQSYCLEFTEAAFNLLFNGENEMSIKQYWLYSPGENASKWDELFDAGIIAIGWDEIGDLTNYNTRREIKEALVQSYGGDGDKRNDVSANDDFLNKMEIGDIVIAKRGRDELLGYGIVNSHYFFDESRKEFKSCRKVDWKNRGVWKADHNLVIKTLTDVTHYESEHPKYDKYYQRLMALMGEGGEEFQINRPSQNLQASNIIFYGPPGTGKTYRLKKEYFDNYTSKESSISKEKHFEYVVENAGWHECLVIALLDLKRASVSEIMDHPWIRKKIEFSQAKNVRATLWGNLQTHTVEDCPYVNVKNRRTPGLFYKNEDSTWQVQEDLVKELTPEVYELKKSVEEFNPDPDKEIKRYRFVTFHQSFSYEDFIEGIKPILPEDGEEVSDLNYKVEDGVFKELCRKAEADPENRYAIFIDEINRGNIAQIFGELITLIEKDKRWGAENQLSALLPYSKKEFRVPKNVDIYGTMNTADRSVEALDTALRRRFSFEEMTPKPEKLTDKEIAGINLGHLLRVINERVELLVDRDHTIGHSYFMNSNLNSTKELATVFNDKVVPLLQEYFYGDFGKIGLVLGAGFIKKNKNNKAQFAEFEYENHEDFKNDTYSLIRMTEDNIIDALMVLLRTKESEQETQAE